jgi:hypothetical protein
MAKRERRFMKACEYRGRGTGRTIEHTYREAEQSGTHEIRAVHRFGPGGEFPDTFIFFTEEWTDDPPIPVTAKGMEFLRDVVEDVLATMQRNNGTKGA